MQKSLLLAAAVTSLTFTHLHNAAAAPSGWQVHVGQKGKPVVLLVHGLTASSRHWTQPANAWNLGSAHYAHASKPKAYKARNRALPHVGVRTVGSAPKPTKSVNGANWFASLKARGYTVATWDQVPCIRRSGATPSSRCLNRDTFAKAVQSARVAYAEAKKLATRQGSKIALIGHSRGGLVIRQLLKDTSSHPQLGWVITLHTPHDGSGLATFGIKMQRTIPSLVSKVPRPLRKYAAKIAGYNKAFFDGVVRVAGLPGARELGYNSSMMRGLRRGERKVAGVKYYSFGGTSTTLNKFYAWTYNRNSAIPHNRPCGVQPRPCRYHVRANPIEIRGLSPLRTSGTDPEMKHGQGDTMVAASRSKIPFSDGHWNYPLHHGEVLWNASIQRQVHELMSASYQLVRMRLRGNRLGSPAVVIKSVSAGSIFGSAAGILGLRSGRLLARSGNRFVARPVGRKLLHAIGEARSLYLVDKRGTLFHARPTRLGFGQGNIAMAKVGGGWQQFSKIVGGYGGLIYAIKGKTLYWYKHRGGTRWAKTTVVGSGWDQFRLVFGGRSGTLFAVKRNGQLFKYTHTGYRDGKKTWAKTRLIASGWNKYSAAMDGGDGYIYAIQKR